jgi:hypothetical protein
MHFLHQNEDELRRLASYEGWMSLPRRRDPVEEPGQPDGRLPFGPALAGGRSTSTWSSPTTRHQPLQGDEGREGHEGGESVRLRPGRPRPSRPGNGRRRSTK